MVSKLEEFRQSAADCRQMAAVAPSEFAKQHWLETTAHWMKMAAAEEGAMGTTRPGQLGRSLEHPHNNISGATTTAAAMKAKATAPRCSRRVTAARLCYLSRNRALASSKVAILPLFTIPNRQSTSRVIDQNHRTSGGVPVPPISYINL